LFGSFQDFALVDYLKLVLVPGVFRISGICLPPLTWKLNFVINSQITEKRFELAKTAWTLAN